MLRSIALILIAVACIGAAPEAASKDAEAAQVQKDVEAIVRALHEADVDTVLEYTHPKIIELQGGPAAARAAVQDAMIKLKSIGMKLESFSFPKKPEFLEGGGRRFAIVPTFTIVSANGQKVESMNFQLGVLEPGAKQWAYVEGSRMNRENVQVFFPGFPADYEFPTFYRRKL